SSLEDVKRRLDSLQRAGAAAEEAARRATAATEADRSIKASELEKADAEIKDLTLKVKDAEGRYRAFVGDGDVAARAMTGVGDQVLALRQALDKFNRTGSPEAYNTVLTGCSALVEMLGRPGPTKTSLGNATCD